MLLNKKRALLAFGAAFALSPISIAIAQSTTTETDGSEKATEKSSYEQITVTARKRNEALIDVPLSIDVFSNQALKDKGLTELQSLASFSPNLDFQNVGNTQPGRWNSSIRFRGMEVDISTPTNQTGGFFVDGVPILGGASSVSFTDIGAVEVIRGPQPVYFGRGTFGGAINYSTVTPGSDFAGGISASYSPTFGSNDQTLWVEGGSDTLSARATVFNRHVGAPFKSATDGGELGEENSTGVSLIVAYFPTDDLSIKTRLAYSEDNDKSPSATMLPYSDFRNVDVGDTLSVNTVNGYEDVILSRGYFVGELPYDESYLSRNTTFFSAPGVGNSKDYMAQVDNGDAPDLTEYGLKSELTTISIALDYSLSEAWDVSGLFGYSKRAVGNLRDSDGYYGEGWITKSYLELDTKSFEGRVSFDDGGAFRFIAGVSSIEIDQYGDVDGGWNFFPQFFTYGYGQSRLDLVNIQTDGVFASVEYDITDELIATVEARYQKEDIVSGQAFHETGEYSGVPTNLNSESLLPRVSLTYKPFEGTTTYISYAEGELPGAVNNIDFEAFPEYVGVYQPTIDPETVETLELGLKQSLLDNNMFFSATLFSQDWKNMKAVDNTLVLNGAFVSPIIPGTSKQQGIELALNWDITENFSITSAYGYTKSEYKDFEFGTRGFVNPASQVSKPSYDGNTLARSPKNSGAFGFIWEDDLNAMWTYSFRTDVTYRGKTYADPDNLVTTASYSLVNLRMNLDNNDDLTLGVYCNNCFDKEGWSTATVASDFVSFFVPGGGRGAVVAPITPREIGVSVDYSF